MRKKTKLYKHEFITTLILAIIVPIIIIGLIVLMILSPEWIIIALPFVICFAGAYIGLIVTGIFTPIYLKETGIKYKAEEYSWEEIKITLLPLMHSSFRYGYIAVFDNKYLFGIDARKQYRKGLWVYVNVRSLRTILQFYNAKFMVLNTKLETEVLPNAAKTVNAKIMEHNSKF